MSKFKVGDWVVPNENWRDYELLGYGLDKDKKYKVKAVFFTNYTSIQLEGFSNRFDQDYFDLADYTHQDNITPQEIQGIERPILEERKVGKVQMELFDEGFPNAIMEVAKVMTWASEHKGYKPHDWVNLPNADSSFPAAASRHRVKSLIQKVDGVSVGKRVDEESAILHKAHEAFNVLAELELMLRGKIK